MLIKFCIALRIVNFATMKIEHYISELLYRYQCVTIPGFGAFLTETQSAQLHETSHSFYPPKKIISFNGYLKNNDGLLANHIAQAEKMTYEIAVTAIQNEVNLWKNSLQNNGAFALKNIGELTLNSEKNLVFVPVDQFNYLTSSFGLTNFVSPLVKREIYKKELELLEEKAPIIFIPEKRSSNLLKYAAVFVLGAGLISSGSYFGNSYYQNKIALETLAVQTRVQEKVNQKIQEATFFIENPLPAVTLTTSKEEKVTGSVTTPYHIVAGSFKNKENATKLYQSLLKSGYNAEILPENEHGLVPVFYGSFTTNDEAQKELAKVKTLKDANAWLLVK